MRQRALASDRNGHDDRGAEQFFLNSLAALVGRAHDAAVHFEAPRRGESLRGERA